MALIIASHCAGIKMIKNNGWHFEEKSDDGGDMPGMSPGSGGSGHFSGGGLKRKELGD